MTQQAKSPLKVSNIPVPGGLDIDQLRTIINSLNLLAEQEEGEYLPIFTSRLCTFYLTIHADRMMWEAVGSPPSLSKNQLFLRFTLNFILHLQVLSQRASSRLRGALPKSPFVSLRRRRPPVLRPLAGMPLLSASTVKKALP